ncbi:type VII secretion system-associated protein [Nocardia sp. NPDC001965]
MLLDPGWKPEDPEQNPPDSMVMGGWALDGSGGMGPFEPNPGYRPADATTPTDPVDRILRLVAGGADMSTRIVPTLCDSVVQIGCDDRGDPLVGPAPDGVLCVPVVTAEAHKKQSAGVRWIPVRGSDLADVVPPDIDILINPAGPVPFRLSTESLRRAR